MGGWRVWGQTRLHTQDFILNKRTRGDGNLIIEIVAFETAALCLWEAKVDGTLGTCVFLAYFQQRMRYSPVNTPSSIPSHHPWWGLSRNKTFKWRGWRWLSGYQTWWPQCWEPHVSSALHITLPTQMVLFSRPPREVWLCLMRAMVHSPPRQKAYLHRLCIWTCESPLPWKELWTLACGCWTQALVWFALEGFSTHPRSSLGLDFPLLPPTQELCKGITIFLLMELL